MNRNILLKEDYPLEKFTNAEYYYIISGLLGLGDPGFAVERLYLSFDQNELDVVPDIKFLFLTENVIYTEDCEKEIIEYCLGKIDRALDNIEMYKWQCDLELAPPVSLIQPTLIEHRPPIIFRPISFLQGINRILREGKFDERVANELFDLKHHINIPNGIQYPFDFGQLGPLRTNFSGNYFLVVEPGPKKRGGSKVNSFHIEVQQNKGLLTFEGESASVHQQFIDSTSIQLYENGESNAVFTQVVQQRNKKYEEHKARMVPVLTDTVLSLLPDLSPVTQAKVLEDETPEELVIYCKEKYDREFDLNVDDLGVAGAHEIAWQEALAILSEDYWGDESKNSE